MDNILKQIKDAEQLFSGYEITGRELARVKALAQKLENSSMTVSVIARYMKTKTSTETARPTAEYTFTSHITRDRAEYITPTTPKKSQARPRNAKSCLCLNRTNRTIA